MSCPYNARAMLDVMRAAQPEATLHDLERMLRAGLKRLKKHKKNSAEVSALEAAIAEVTGERAMIQARRASAPRLPFCHEYLKQGGTR